MSAAATDKQLVFLMLAAGASQLHELTDLGLVEVIGQEVLLAQAGRELVARALG